MILISGSSERAIADLQRGEFCRRLQPLRCSYDLVIIKSKGRRWKFCSKGMEKQELRKYLRVSRNSWGTRI